MKNQATNVNRLYYLDWLRVIAFSILLFEHCAEIFVPWNFWVKNDDISPALGYFITLLKPWRMPLLFIVSGAAVFLACKKKSSLGIFRERAIRILLPLVAAMLLVIPPQIYFIRLQEGYQGSLWQFYQLVFEFSWFPKGNMHWLHLWYLGFIFSFTLLVIPILPGMRGPKLDKFLGKIDSALRNPVALVAFGFVLSLPYYFVNNFISKGNLAQLTFYFPFFLFGLTIFLRPNTQQTLVKHRHLFLALAALAMCTLFALSFSTFEGQNLVKQAVNDKYKPTGIFALQTLNTWVCVLAILGYAIRLMNFKTRGLVYANEAVYPFYILHQTVIVAIGYYVVQMDASISWKLFLVSLLSFGGIWVFYEYAIKRTTVTRLIFGLKPVAKAQEPTPKPLEANPLLIDTVPLTTPGLSAEGAEAQVAKVEKIEVKAEI